jgi:hypothetical protein
MAGGNTGLLCGAYAMLVFGLTTYSLAGLYATVLLWTALGYPMSQDAGSKAAPPETSV